MAVVHDAFALLICVTPRTSPVIIKGSNQEERAVQSVGCMARTLRLDLARRFNHLHGGSAHGKTAYAHQFDAPYATLVLLFSERVMWKDPTLQPAKLRSSWDLVCGWRDSLASSAREWASLSLARFGAGVRQSERRQV